MTETPTTQEGQTPTPPEYATGAVKQDPATLSVAVRTNIPAPYYDHEWGVMTIDRGGHYASYDEVQNWDDMASGAVAATTRKKDA